MKGRNEMSFLRRVSRNGECVGGGVALASAMVATALAASSASAEVVNYTDKAAWLGAAGAITTIGVPNVPAGVLNNTYLPLGLNLSGTGISGGAIPNEFADIWGVPQGTNVFIGSASGMWQFSAPFATSFAMEWLFWVPMTAHVYYGLTWLGSVSWPADPQGDYSPKFWGLTSSTPFTRVVISGGTPFPAYGKTVMFSQIPAPGALALLALAPLASRRRRR